MKLKNRLNDTENIEVSRRIKKERAAKSISLEGS